MVNFTKYNYINNPPDVEYSLQPGEKGVTFIGIFELNKDNESYCDFNKLLLSHHEAYQNLTLGLVPQRIISI